MARRAGVDVGGSKILGVVADPDDGSRPEVEARDATPRGAEALVDAVVGVVAKLGPVDSLGLGVPGLVDNTGRLRVGPNLPGVLDYPFAAALEDRLGIRVTAENDATCALWAEHEVGAAAGARDAGW